MAINLETIRQLSKVLEPEEVRSLVRFASQQDHLEATWQLKLNSFFNKVDREVARYLFETGRLPDDIRFDDFFTDHAFHVMKQAIVIANGGREEKAAPPRLSAKPPKGRIPTSLRELMVLWDRWRTKGEIPPRTKKIADRVKKAYLQKVQSIWLTYSSDFREGAEYSLKSVTDAVRKASKSQRSRSKMIVETETTYYYNKTRRDIYDKSDDVTHYLFVAIRDFRTTKWCKTRQGLVYAKTDPLLQDETPPCHWNCRSELLPLTPDNPRHKKLIENRSLWRRNNSPEPLPQGWTGR